MAIKGLKLNFDANAWFRDIGAQFQGLNHNREESLEWARANHASFMGQTMVAVGSSIMQHVKEKGTENIPPAILKAMGMTPDKTDGA